MKKILNKTIFCTLSVLVLFFSLNAPSNAAYCNSPCANPCAPSRTVCEGSHCTTYCNASSSYNAVYYSTPGVSFSYSTPNVSFSISNEVYSSRPIVISNAYRPVYHRVPPKPQMKPAPKPSVNHKPAQNHKPANKKPAHPHV